MRPRRRRTESRLPPHVFDGRDGRRRFDSVGPWAKRRGVPNKHRATYGHGRPPPPALVPARAQQGRQGASPPPAFVDVVDHARSLPQLRTVSSDTHLHRDRDHRRRRKEDIWADDASIGPSIDGSRRRPPRRHHVAGPPMLPGGWYSRSAAGGRRGAEREGLPTLSETIPRCSSTTTPRKTKKRGVLVGVVHHRRSRKEDTWADDAGTGPSIDGSRRRPPRRHHVAGPPMLPGGWYSRSAAGGQRGAEREGLPTLSRDVVVDDPASKSRRGVRVGDSASRDARRRRLLVKTRRGIIAGDLAPPIHAARSSDRRRQIRRPLAPLAPSPTETSSNTHRGPSTCAGGPVE